MGAGSCEDHYMQDAAECYWTFICQRELEKLDLNITSVTERETEFTDYCSLRGITECFQSCDYKTNLDTCVEEWVKNLVDRYPGKKIDITNVEAEYRNLGMKGDFTITLDDGIVISVSLKNYRCGYDSIQLKSGTWHSIINNFALPCAEGPGMYIDCDNGRKFRAQGKSKVKRNKNYRAIGGGVERIIEQLEEIDKIVDEVKQKFVYSPETKFFTEEVAEMWIKDCCDYGNRGIDIVIKALNNLPKEQIKLRILEETDLCHKEELLLVGKNGDMMCSLFNVKYNKLLQRINCEDCDMSYCKYAKNLRFNFFDSQGDILHIDIPFTLQKNGAWYLPKEKYDDEIYHRGERTMLRYGERRPNKSKQMNTSTNIWFNIKKHL